MKVKPSVVIMPIISICILSVLILFWVKLWTTGTDSDDYDTVCIKGHEYHVANFLTKIASAIILDDDGKPIKCKE
jgi:hypothetical protein